MTTQSRQPHTTNHVFTPSASAAGPATKRPIGEASADSEPKIPITRPNLSGATRFCISGITGALKAAVAPKRQKAASDTAGTKHHARDRENRHEPLAATPRQHDHRSQQQPDAGCRLDDGCLEAIAAKPVVGHERTERSQWQEEQHGGHDENQQRTDATTCADDRESLAQVGDDTVTFAFRALGIR